MIRFSTLKNMARSPAHYRYSVDVGRGDTAAFRAGRLVHALVLGGEYAVFDGTRRGKAWDAFQAQHAAADDIFTASEMERARPVADAVLSHPEAARLLEGQRELEVKWSWLGRDCAGRLDVAHPQRVVDLKTTTDAHPERFQRAAMRLAYHAQLAWYRNGLSLAQPSTTRRECYIVAVESSPPYPVVIHKLTEEALDKGERLCRLWMEQLATCEQSGHWPAYTDSVVPFDVPDLDNVLLIDGEEVAA